MSAAYNNKRDSQRGQLAAGDEASFGHGADQVVAQIEILQVPPRADRILRDLRDGVVRSGKMAR